MKKTFIFSSAVVPFAAADFSAFSTLPISIATANYTGEQVAIINRLYSRHVAPLAGMLYSSYAQHSEPYLQTGKKPSSLQSMHTILSWFATFCEQGDMTDAQAAAFFYKEIGRTSQQRRELISLMWVRAADCITPQKPKTLPVAYPTDKL